MHRLVRQPPIVQIAILLFSILFRDSKGLFFDEVDRVEQDGSRPLLCVAAGNKDGQILQSKHATNC